MATARKLSLIQATILGPTLDWLEGNGAVVQRHLDRACIPRELVERDGAAETDQGDLPRERDSFAQSLQRLLSSQFPFTKLPTLELAANITGVSRRTIKRRLYDEGLTYRGLLDRLRFEVAQKMLGVANTSIREIASEVGYSGPNNFIRAFKRIAGVTPTEYRENLSIE